jgi:hypothetical protein
MGVAMTPSIPPEKGRSRLAAVLRQGLAEVSMPAFLWHLVRATK